LAFIRRLGEYEKTAALSDGGFAETQQTNPNRSLFHSGTIVERPDLGFLSFKLEKFSGNPRNAEKSTDKGAQQTDSRRNRGE
jgi:hypothetical protein